MGMLVSIFVYMTLHVTVIVLDIHMYACIINHTIISVLKVTCYPLINFVSANILTSKSSLVMFSVVNGLVLTVPSDLYNTGYWPLIGHHSTWK